MDWLRWHQGTVNDPKWRVVARRAGLPVHAVVAVWAAVLENANESDERGTLDRFDAEDVGAALDLDASQVQAVVDAMQGKVLKGPHLTGWDRRQPKREDPSTERVRRHRERQKSEPEGEVKRDVTQCNAPEESRGEEKREETSSSILKLHARDGLEDQASEIIRLANRGMAENPAIGDACNPIPTGHGSRQIVLDWLAEGIPPALAGSVVHQRAKEYQPDGRRRQITTMRYFDAAVREAGDRAAAKATPPPVWQDPELVPAAVVPDDAPPEMREWAERIRQKLEADEGAAAWVETTRTHLRKVNGEDRDFQRMSRPNQDARIQVALLNAYGQKVGDPMPGALRRAAAR